MVLIAKRKRHPKQKRTFKAPCCGKKIQIVFPYGQLLHRCFCPECGSIYELAYSSKKSRRKGYDGKMAHRMIKKVALD